MTEQQQAEMSRWQQRARESLLAHNPPTWARVYLEHTEALEVEVGQLRRQLVEAEAVGEGG